jgi:alpha-glucosidase
VTSISGAPPAAQQPVPHLLDRPHHDGSARYVGSDVPAVGDVVRVRLRLPADGPEGDVLVRVLKDGEPGYAAATPDGGSSGERWYSADVEVHNPVTPYRFVLPHPDGYRWLNGTASTSGTSRTCTTSG